MRDAIHWLPRKMITEHFETLTVYVKHWHAPFAGYMVAADTAFTIPAKVRIRGRWFKGYVSPYDGMAYQQEHGFSVFYYYNSSQALKGWNSRQRPRGLSQTKQGLPT